MSKKPYLSTEMQKYQTKQKRQNKLLLQLSILLFIPPLLLFPAYPRNDWQYSIYKYITENLLITVGSKGLLPFFTILSSIYITIIMFFLSCYVCWLFLKKYGIQENFQKKIYSLFLQFEFSSSYKYPWLEIPIIKKTLVSSIFILCFLGSIWHFVHDEISFQSGSRKGALIEWSYNYRIGVLFWEFIISLLSISPIFISLFYSFISAITISVGWELEKFFFPKETAKLKNVRKKDDFVNSAILSSPVIEQHLSHKMLNQFLRAL